MTQPKLVDTAAVADLLGVTTQTIYRMVADGRIPHYRVRGQLRFDPDEVIKAMKAAPPPEAVAP